MPIGGGRAMMELTPRSRLIWKELRCLEAWGHHSLGRNEAEKGHMLRSQTGITTAFHMNYWAFWKNTMQLLCSQNRLPLGVFRHFSGGIWRPLHAFFVSWVINLLILQWKRRYWRKGRMWYFPKSKHKLGKRFVTGVAPSLQNWWTVERPLVGSTPIRFRHYWIKKKKVSLKYRINFLLFFFCPIITPHLKVMNGKQQ